MSAPEPIRQSSGRPDGGQFAASARAEDSTVTLAEPAGPTAQDRAQLAAISRDAIIVREATIRVELGCAKMLAQGVLRQWPYAKYLVLTDSNDGSGSQYASSVLVSSNPKDSLAELEYEELTNGANPEDMAGCLTAGGPWMKYATRAHPWGGSPDHIHLDLHAAAALELPQPTETISVAPPEFISPGASLKRRNAAQRVNEQQVAAVVLKMVPDAVSWTVDSDEWDVDGESNYFYTDSGLWAKKADGTEVHVDPWMIRGAEGRQARAELETALASLSDRHGPLDAESTHEARIESTR